MEPFKYSDDTNVGEFKRISIPLIRRIYPRLVDESLPTIPFEPDNEFKEAIQKWTVENPIVLDSDIELIESFLAKDNG